MDPTLAVIGLNFRTSPVAIRERFWISEPRRNSALYHLVRSEGVDEVIVLTTCNRTEFILWTSDVPAASDSVLRFLGQEYDLRLCEWTHFYRLMDDVALAHVFRVASSLDSMLLGDPEVMARLSDAWAQAKAAGCTGRFLDCIVQKALSVAKRIHSELSITDDSVSLPYAAVELAMEQLGQLAGREVLVIGAGRMAESAARCFMSAGAGKVTITSRASSSAEELAARLKVAHVPFERRRHWLETADVVVSSTSSPHSVISGEQAKAAAGARNGRPLLLIDMAVPRDVDPAVGEVEGMRLFDIDDLERLVRRNSGERQAAAAAAEKIIFAEVHGFRNRMAAEQAVPALATLRQHLDELCHEELAVLRKEYGPFTADQDQALAALAAHITQRIASSLARELKDLPDKNGPQVLSAALLRLIGLDEAPEVATELKN